MTTATITFQEYMDQGLERSRKAARPKKRKRTGQYSNADARIKFLRQRTCRLNFGLKVYDPIEDTNRPLPELNAEKLKARYNSRRFGASLTNEQFADHFKGARTFYFWADHCANTSKILLMLDIDCHHGEGSVEGARRFAEDIKGGLFPGMYYEPSTHGTGVHGYLVVRKEGITAKRVRAMGKNLERYLKALAEAHGADISGVEIKGLPPVVKYDRAGNIADIVFGSLAKLPRGSGVVGTCKVDYHDLAVLDVADIKVESPEPARPSPTAATPRPKRRCGSYDCRIVTQDVLDQLPALTAYAERLLGQWTESTTLKAGRWAVTATDLAQFFAIMASIKPDPNDSLPVRRIGRLWEAVHAAGDFERPWNHHRVKAIRDLLSQHGHVEWIEYRYQNLPDGKGRACRWRLSYLMESAVRSFISHGEATSVDTAAALPDGKHEYRQPKWYDFVLERQRRWWEEAERRLERLFAA